MADTFDQIRTNERGFTTAVPEPSATQYARGTHIVSFLSNQTLKSVINHGISSWRMDEGMCRTLEYAVLFVNRPANKQPAIVTEAETPEGTVYTPLPHGCAHLIFRVKTYSVSPEFPDRKVLHVSHYAEIYNTHLRRSGTQNPVYYFLHHQVVEELGPLHRLNWIAVPK